MLRYAMPFAAAVGSFAMMISTADAATITLMSNANTLGAATTIDTATAGDTSGATFSAVDVGAYGTYTGVPSNSPAGTLVINIAPGDGESGFFRDTFTLPTGFTGASISGAASIDDATVAYLNGHALDVAGHEISFTSSDASFFNVGVNTLDISDLNTGGGPSGGGFYAEVTYGAASAVPEPSVWALMFCGIFAVGLTLRRRRHLAVFA